MSRIAQPIHIHNCALHPSNSLVYFCESCRDAVCQICVTISPHCGQHHQVSKLQQASQLRKNFFQCYISQQINPFRLKTLDWMMKIKQIIQAKQQQNIVISKDVNIQFEAIEQRLKIKEDELKGKFQAQIKFAQSILNLIDDLTYSFDSVIKEPQKMLLLYKKFNQQLKYLEALDILDPKQTQRFNVTLELPQEILEAQHRAATLPHWVQKNTLLNLLINRTVQYFNYEIFETKKKVEVQQKKILHLYNNTNSKLLESKAAMVCCFCLSPFTIEEGNELCAFNKSYKSQPQYEGLNIPHEIRGIKMHYWVKSKKSERIIPDIKSHSLVRLQHKKLFKSALWDLRIVKTKLRKFDIESGTKKAYISAFSSDDPTSKGVVTFLAFIFVMTNKFEIDQIQAQFIAQMLKSKQYQNGNMVEYTKLDDLIENHLIPYQRFIQEEQEIQKNKSIAPPSLKFRY